MNRIANKVTPEYNPAWKGDVAAIGETGDLEKKIRTESQKLGTLKLLADIGLEKNPDTMRVITALEKCIAYLRGKQMDVITNLVDRHPEAELN